MFSFCSTLKQMFLFPFVFSFDFLSLLPISKTLVIFRFQKQLIFEIHSPESTTRNSAKTETTQSFAAAAGKD